MIRLSLLLLLIPSVCQAKSFQTEFMCLAKNIYHEAGIESSKGKAAVAQVTLNRVANPAYPKTVCGVVHQKNQFSWVGSKVKIDYKSKAWKESTRIAYKALLKQTYVLSKNVLFYHAVYIRPAWKYQKVAVIGNHIFYKEKT